MPPQTPSQRMLRNPSTSTRGRPAVPETRITTVRVALDDHAPRHTTCRLCQVERWRLMVATFVPLTQTVAEPRVRPVRAIHAAPSRDLEADRRAGPRGPLQ